jgi:uncharacterized phiE125 gp8 family phage protein
LNRLLVQRTVTEYFDKWPDDNVFQLYYPIDLGSATVTYVDEDNVNQTFSMDVDDKQHPAKVKLSADTSFPVLYDKVNAISIAYTSGYSSVPYPIIQAMKVQVAELFENREDKVRRFPTVFNRILQPYRLHRW